MIAYLRVSTDRQGRSGLGIDAQREAIGRFAEAEKLQLSWRACRGRNGQGR
jgi:DNA invertase Pin-like site-specific DNA recombinase